MILRGVLVIPAVSETCACTHARALRHSADLWPRSKAAFHLAWQSGLRRAQFGERELRGTRMKDKPASADTDWILKAMVAVAASDGNLDGHETSLIQQLYLD